MAEVAVANATIGDDKLTLVQRRRFQDRKGILTIACRCISLSF